MQKRLLELSDRLKELRDIKSDLEAQAKANNADIDTVQAEMIELMLTDELTSFNRDGVTFSLVVQEYPAAEPERKDDLWNAMRKKGYGHLFTINSQTLQGTLKEIIANNDDSVPKWLDGLIKTAEKSSIRLTRPKR